MHQVLPLKNKMIQGERFSRVFVIALVRHDMDRRDVSSVHDAVDVMRCDAVMAHVTCDASISCTSYVQFLVTIVCGVFGTFMHMHDDVDAASVLHFHHASISAVVVRVLFPLWSSHAHVTCITLHRYARFPLLR